MPLRDSSPFVANKEVLTLRLLPPDPIQDATRLNMRPHSEAHWLIVEHQSMCQQGSLHPHEFKQLAPGCMSGLAQCAVNG